MFENTISKDEFHGFADLYLKPCVENSQVYDQVDTEVYAKLIELDSKLGITPSEQLFWCLLRTTRSDIIKVQIHDLSTFHQLLIMILDYRHKIIG